MKQQTQMNKDMQACIESCQQCHSVCLQTAMTTCLEMGEQHVEPEHFRLMMDCTAVCQTAANFMLSSSTVYPRICGLCAEVCDACAESCERIGGMENCVASCHECAEKCRRMSGGEPRMGAGSRQSARM